MNRHPENSPTVLIVNDDPSVARMLTDQCALMGFQRQAEATNIEIRSRTRVLLVDDDDSVSRFVASRIYDLGI